MDRIGPQRTIAQIESELLEAEAAFADADARLHKAQRDRASALQTINERQVEFDHAVAILRQRGAAGSIWQREAARHEGALILQPEQIAQEGEGQQDAASERIGPQSVAAEINRIRSVVDMSRGGVVRAEAKRAMSA